jgi:hypothetical protein
VNYPYFTLPDPFLIRAGGGRDPLSLQPVWSAFGRGLVPNLASPITKVKGIIAVVLIHWLDEKSLRAFLSDNKHSFRDYFRLMEGLLEYYLWSTSVSKDEHCYGIRALEADGENFSVTAKDDRTAVNGLYQYYRGTCRRADLLDGSWGVAIDVSNALSQCWNTKALQTLEHVLSTPLKGKDESLTPSHVLEKNPELKSALQATFGSLEIKKILQQRLLGDQSHVNFAKQCASLLSQDIAIEDGGWVKNWFNQLTSWANEESSLAKAMRNPLEKAQKCEPFLLILQDCFDFILLSHGTKVGDVAKELQKYEREIKQRAQGFLTLSTVSDTERLKQMLDLAQIAILDIKEFLLALIHHHSQCMKERDRNPLVLLDDGLVIVPVASDRDKKSIQDRLELGIPWDNGYYLWNAGVIHKQLFEES